MDSSKFTQFATIDLHRHLDGNIRPRTIFELAKRQHSPLSVYTLSELEKLIYIDDRTSDLLAFLKRLDYGVSVLQTPDDCFRVAYENIEDAHREGLDYVELRFSPYYMAMAHRLSMEGVVAAVTDGVAAALKDFSVEANLIGILSRTFGTEACAVELDAILRFADRFVAVDLAGDESNFPPELFIEHFQRVKDAGLNATIHAGEAGGAENIWTSIYKLHATRIGHGVNAIYDPRLLDHLRENNIGIESCLTSNYQTATWPNISDHPLTVFLESGIEACICTDDPGVSNITLAHEYEVASRELGFDDTRLLQIKNNAERQRFRM